MNPSILIMASIEPMLFPCKKAVSNTVPISLKDTAINTSATKPINEFQFIFYCFLFYCCLVKKK